MVPAPPDAFPINRLVAAQGTVLHRLHSSAYAGDAFNPCNGAPTRFAPIRTVAGECVPSLYAASMLDAAIFETVFHDVPANAGCKSLPILAAMARSHSVLQVSRAVTLASLFAPDLKKMRLTRDQLIATSPVSYAQTAAWAAAIHAQHDDVQGLVWTSNQSDPDRAYLFFGDRISAGDLVVTLTRDAATDEGLLTDIRNAGLRAGITLTI